MVLCTKLEGTRNFLAFVKGVLKKISLLWLFIKDDCPAKTVTVATVVCKQTRASTARPH